MEKTSFTKRFFKMLNDHQWLNQIKSIVVYPSQNNKLFGYVFQSSQFFYMLYKLIHINLKTKLNSHTML